MRKLFALSLVALLLGVGAVALIETEPGYVLITYGNYTVETSLWVGLVVIGVFVMLLYWLIQFTHFILGGRRSLSNWLGGRRAGQSQRLTSRGLINFIEGNWSTARSQLLKGTEQNDTPLLNYLVAARASYQLNEPDKMRQYLSAAEESDAEAGIAVELTQAELKLDAGQYEPAAATLVRARRNAGKHPHVLDLLCQAYLGLGDWPALVELLPELKKYRVMSEDDYHALERKVHSQLLETSAERAEGDAGEALRRQWQQVPAELKRDQVMLRGYTRLLIAAEAFEAAEKVILRAQKQSWDSGMARLYGYVEGPHPARQLASAEAWLGQHERDAQLQLCLGRLAARNELWGKAREYFENSYRLNRNAEVCAELGRLLTAQGEERQAAAYYREGLALEEAGLPELPLPEGGVSDSHRPEPADAAVGR